MVDYGYVQGTSSELLKAYVFSEPVMVEAPSKGIANLKLPDTKTISSMAAQNSIMAGTQDRSSKNEIFVDIVEELNVTFSSTGTVQNMEIDGRIQMKSFLHGTPDLLVGLNQDLAIGKTLGLRSGLCVYITPSLRRYK